MDSRCETGFQCKMRSMNKQILSIFLSLAVVLSGCSNLFEKMAVKDSDAALYEDATKALNAGNYDLSLEKFGQLSSGYLASPEVKKYYAGALAGKCGMNFTELLNSLGSVDISTMGIFQYFMNLFTGKVISPAHCTLAEAQMKELWTIRSRTQGEQLFMVLLSMAKMGTYLRNKADKDGPNNLGDGAMDGSFNECSNVNDDDHLTDEEVTEVITGFSQMLLNITSFSASLSGSVDSSVSAINALCGLSTPNPCSTTEASEVTPVMIEQMRDFIAAGASWTPMIGIGSCAGLGDPGACCP